MRTLYALLFAIAAPVTRAATFTITYNGLPANGQAAFQYASDIWGGILESDVPIKVMVTYFPLGGTTLGITFPNGRRDFAGAPLTDTWYATSLANSIAGVELNPGENDIEIYFNASSNWYFETTGTPGPSEHDFVSVALHEIGHGLGFVGLSKKEGALGSLGLLQASDFAPLVTTFPWPQLDTLPSIFDRYLNDELDGPLALMENPGTLLGVALTGNSLYFNGPIAMAENGGVAPCIYAPTTFSLGSSCVHLNESTYPPGNANELMTPFSAASDVNHWPGPLCLAMLRDIGWTLAPDVGIAGLAAHAAPFSVHPDPADDVLHLVITNDFGRGTITLTDMSGRALVRSTDQHLLDVTDLPTGTYILVRELNGARTHARFVKR